MNRVQFETQKFGPMPASSYMYRHTAAHPHAVRLLYPTEFTEAEANMNDLVAEYQQYQEASADSGEG